MFRLTTLCAVLAVAAAPSLAQEARPVTGKVTYLQRIALPPTAKLTVLVQGPHGVTLVAQDTALGERSVPVEFSFDLPQGVAGTAIFAFVLETGETVFSSEPIAVFSGTEPLDLGEIRLSSGETTRATYSCVHGLYQAAFQGESLRLTDANGQETELRQEPSADGARYVAVDGGMEFWDTGATARLTRAGEEPVECTLVTARPYHAGGFEPSWGVELTGETYVFGDASGAPPQTGQLTQAPTWQDGAVVWPLAEGLVLTIRQEICRDEATGMPRPESVSLVHGDVTYQGCGGAPLDLLTGTAWRISEMQGSEDLAQIEAEITFGTEGTVYGRAFCNNYNASFALSGEALQFGSGMMTMMACDEASMKLDQHFHQHLTNVMRFDLTEEGALQLLDAEGAALITARR